MTHEVKKINLKAFVEYWSNMQESLQADINPVRQFIQLDTELSKAYEDVFDAYKTMIQICKKRLEK